MRQNPRFFLALTFAGALGTGCNSEEFQRRDTIVAQPAPSTPKEEPPVEPAPEVIETFSLGFERSAIDMVWVIDNSGSMSEEAAQVRANFSKFISTLGGATNLKVALISRKTGATGVDLSTLSTSASNVQEDVVVFSNNPLAILASAICPKQDAPADTTQLNVCGRDFSAATAADKRRVTNSNSIYTVSGKLAGFFRPKAKRVFVTVTDDDAVLVNDTNFLDLVTPHLTDQPFMFSFRGVASNAATGCGIAAPGLSYDRLSQATAGAAYDICDADWSQHFEKLTDSVESIATTTFTLSQTNIEVIAVRIDGVEIARDLYEVNGGTLTVKPEAFQGQQKNIDVVYRKM